VQPGGGSFLLADRTLIDETGVGNCEHELTAVMTFTAVFARRFWLSDEPLKYV
jgi:hypothetical protein